MPSVDGQGFGGFTAWRAISRTPAPRPHTCMLCSKGSHWSQKSLRRAQLPRTRNMRTVALSRPSGGLGSKGGCWLPLCDQVGPWAPVSPTGKTSNRVHTVMSRWPLQRPRSPTILSEAVSGIVDGQWLPSHTPAFGLLFCCVDLPRARTHHLLP